MQNPDDKRVMAKIRSTLEEYEPQCTPESWSKMSALLDQQKDAITPARWRVWINGFMWGIALSVFIASSYFIFFNRDRVTVNQVGIQVTPAKEISSESESTQTKHKSTISASNPRISGNAQLHGSNLDFSNNFKRNIDLNHNFDSHYIPSNQYYTDYNNVNTTIGNSDSLFRRVEQIKSHSKQITLQKSEIAIESIKSEPLPVEWRNYSFAFKAPKKADKSKRKGFDWPKFDLSLNLQDDLYKNLIGPDKIKLSYSPEVVFGKFQSKKGISQGVELMLEGPISSNLSAGIGFSYRQYSWQKQTVFRSVVTGFPDDSTSVHYVIDSIHVSKGDWKYFEVPLGLSLHFVHQAKSEVILNSRIAAIVMQSENYKYDRIIGGSTFSQQNEPKPFSNYNILGSITLGLEYRHSLNERWSLWAEPYFKWYLKGIGDTPFKPRCFGVNVGLVYQFNLH